MPEKAPFYQTLTCALDPARAQALHASLGRAGAAPSAGAALPPFWHQIYFWDAQPPDALGRDGHPRTGQGLIPDMGLPRRMWAGGRLTFHAPLTCGTPAKKRSTVEATKRKEGRSGPLGFVTLRHEIWQGGELCITEWQDLVYRQEADPATPRPVAPQAPTDEESATRRAFNSTLLFRYSALTFNGHRIHYDEVYARQIEGYAGLVVHGPLLAHMLMEKAQAELGPLAAFRFRATAPLMHSEAAMFCRKGQRLWVRAEDGRLCMEAEATPA
ncbi:MaoC family dehydratase N-terminal domain-containing protein [Pseudoruegeria sp. SHC-113]|uniref:FAS1-like dehydratase domain-containing protein n=1 Tax=Pseudoruegeria sp. SHC-113 TaxID=2855439 RepID=UPI0021BBA727|nr:MaoC family dehydratase N-terminal domain-containing protein [Pseudoruegeria sp. SHC-113]MCT8159184.1 acyl dehydratase [Pseudoruegeria sp. SHC-113]